MTDTRFQCRLAVAGTGDAHLIALMTLTRVLHGKDRGKALVACHLPLLTEVVLKGMDPQIAALRACRQVTKCAAIAQGALLDVSH